MVESFRCNSCRKQFEINDLGHFSYSQGQICKECWSKISKVREENAKKYKIKEDKKFEDKIRGIINKVLEERGIK